MFLTRTHIMKRAHTPFLALCLLLSACSVSHAQTVTDERVGEMVDGMIAYLLTEQKAEGDWEGNNAKSPKDRHWGGETALITYALLTAGESFQKPAISKAVRWLQDIEMNGTYAYGVRCHVWSHLPNEFGPNLAKDGQWLLAATFKGIYDYEPPTKDELSGRKKFRIDHSASQYAYLGLWEWVKRGGSFTGGFWEAVESHWTATQNKDGGWGYQPGDKSTGSMTAAGVTVLYIVQQELYKNSPKAKPEIQATINGGLKWLNENFKGDDNPGRNGKDVYYYLYGIERVALAGGIKEFNGQDWFVVGAKYIEAQNDKKNNGSVKADHGGEKVSTAFALMFLSRGRVPVWVNKIALPEAAWNNRPNDMYFLTRYLSDMREHELNWQVVSIQDPSNNWLNAPVAYISTADPLKLTDEQVANLKNYIDRGGLLYINPENNSTAVVGDAQKLAQQMYPDLKLENMDPTNPVVTLVTDVTSLGPPPLMVLNNGVRDLMIVGKRDWSFDFQANIRFGASGPWSYMLNMQTYVSDRAKLPNRLEDPIERKNTTVKSRGDFTLVRATHGGNANIEPMLFDNAVNALYNRTGYDVTVEDKPLEEIGSSDAPLVYLAGTDAVQLTQPQIQAIETYIDGGGTILIDTLGGRGKFTSSVEQQIASIGQATILVPSTPAVSGVGLGNTGTELNAAGWRPFTSGGNMSFGGQFRLRAIFKDGRPAVITSAEDIGMGVMGIRRFGINGYSIATARSLFANIMAAAKQQP